MLRPRDVEQWWHFALANGPTVLVCSCPGATLPHVGIAMIEDRFRPLKTLEWPEIFARARSAAAKRPSDIETLLHCWAEASARHIALGKMMQLRTLLEGVSLARPQRFKTPGIEPPDWFLDAYAAARALAKGRSARGIYRVYVLLLRGQPIGGENELGLYVGESHLEVERRLAQHLEGTNASRPVHRFGIAALPSFTPHLAGLTRHHSKRLEAELAARLREVVVRYRASPTRVEGGH